MADEGEDDGEGDADEEVVSDSESEEEDDEEDSDSTESRSIYGQLEEMRMQLEMALGGDLGVLAKAYSFIEVRYPPPTPNPTPLKNKSCIDIGCVRKAATR